MVSGSCSLDPPEQRPPCLTATLKARSTATAARLNLGAVRTNASGLPWGTQRPIVGRGKPVKPSGDHMMGSTMPAEADM